VPYRHNADLPPAIRNHLPDHAQDIFRAAFNAAWTGHVDDPRQEEAAHRIAWAAVKRRYRKVGDEWVSIKDRS
jgi:cation transport regulator